MCETQPILSMHKCGYSSESNTSVSLHTSFVYLYILSKSHSGLTVPSDTYLQPSEYIISNDSRMECKHVFQVGEGDLREKLIYSLDVTLESSGINIQGFKLNVCRIGDCWKHRVLFEWHYSLPKYLWPKFYLEEVKEILALSIKGMWLKFRR